MRVQHWPRVLDWRANSQYLKNNKKNRKKSRHHKWQKIPAQCAGGRSENVRTLGLDFSWSRPLFYNLLIFLTVESLHGIIYSTRHVMNTGMHTIQSISVQVGTGDVLLLRLKISRIVSLWMAKTSSISFVAVVWLYGFLKHLIWGAFFFAYQFLLTYMLNAYIVRLQKSNYGFCICR